MAGEPIVCDIFPRSDRSGYWGDMTRTFCKGKASAIVRKAFAAVVKGSETALSMIRSGVCAAEVHLAAAETMAAAGFPSGRNAEGIPCGFIHGLGHGLGLEIHEGPRVSPLNRKALVERERGQCGAGALRSGLGRHPSGRHCGGNRKRMPKFQYDGEGAGTSLLRGGTGLCFPLCGTGKKCGEKSVFFPENGLISGWDSISY